MPSGPYAHYVTNERETIVAARYQHDGWVMLRGGAPDFFALRVSDGQIVDVLAVEVKSPIDGLSYEQAIVRLVLERHGIAYKVEVEA